MARDPDSSGGWSQTLWSALQILPLVGIIFLVLGLVMFGIAQPTEAAAVGIFGSIIMSVIYGKFSGKMLYEACFGAAFTTATILIIIASSKLFSQLLAFTGATAGLIDFTSQLAINRWLLFFIMMLAVFFFCKFMDQLALMLIAVPVYSPLIVHLGFDPIWFWMLFLINITLGGITPPFGYTMFVFKSVRPEVAMTEIYWSAAPDCRCRAADDGADEHLSADRDLASGDASVVLVPVWSRQFLHQPVQELLAVVELLDADVLIAAVHAAPARIGEQARDPVGRDAGVAQPAAVGVAAGHDRDHRHARPHRLGHPGHRRHHLDADR